MAMCLVTRNSLWLLYTTTNIAILQVYEHLVFSGSKHISLRSLPGMHERCIRIGSAGKTFSLTAWKVQLINHYSHPLSLAT